jgi:hypothetical protein
MRCKRLAWHPTARQLVFNINNTYKALSRWDVVNTGMLRKVLTDTIVPIKHHEAAGIRRAASLSYLAR